jgi:hypothetical protein
MSRDYGTGPSPDDTAKDDAWLLAEDIKKEAYTHKTRELGREAWHAEKYGHVELPDFKFLDHFLAEEDADEQYVIPGLWAQDTPILFAAQYKAGKTTVRDNVVKVLADGGKLFGQYDCAPYPYGTIVILDLELAPHMMRGWLRAHDIQKQDRVVVVPMRGKGASLNLTVPEVRAKWVARLKQWDASVVLLDCLRPVLDSLGLNENSEAGRFLNAGFDPLLVEAGGLQGMVIQHMGHNGERARGDSSMLGWGDSWKLLRKDPDNPSSKRFFTGYGRFGEVPESELSYNQTTRELAIVGGSRKTSGAGADLDVIYQWLKTNPDVSQTACIKRFDKNQTDYETIPERRVKLALEYGERYGQIHVSTSGKLGGTKRIRATGERRVDQPE